MAKRLNGRGIEKSAGGSPKGTEESGRRVVTDLQIGN